MQERAIRTLVAVETQVGRAHDDHKGLFFRTPFIRVVLTRLNRVNAFIEHEAFAMTTDLDAPAAVAFLDEVDHT